jgi:hypothetical protein
VTYPMVSLPRVWLTRIYTAPLFFRLLDLYSKYSDLDALHKHLQHHAEGLPRTPCGGLYQKGIQTQDRALAPNMPPRRATWTSQRVPFGCLHWTIAEEVFCKWGAQ